MQRREPRRAEGDRVAAPNGIVIDAASRQLRSLCSELSNATHAPPLRFLLLYELYSPHLEAYFPRFLAPSIIIIIIIIKRERRPVSLSSSGNIQSVSQSVRERPTTSSRFKPESSIIPARIVLALWIFRRQGCFSESLFSRVSRTPASFAPRPVLSLCSESHENRDVFR